MTGIGEERSIMSPENIFKCAGFTRDSELERDLGEFVSGCTKFHDLYSRSEITILYTCFGAVIIAFGMFGIFCRGYCLCFYANFFMVYVGIICIHR